MGETRDVFKKIRDTNGTFHAKMGTIKDRNCMGQGKTQKRLRRASKNIQNCLKKERKKEKREILMMCVTTVV